MPAYTLDRHKITTALHRLGLVTCTAQADHIGVSRPTLAGALSGATTPQAATLSKIAVATGLSYEDILVAAPPLGRDALWGRMSVHRSPVMMTPA